MRKILFILLLPITAVACLEEQQCLSFDNDGLLLEFYDKSDPDQPLSIEVSSIFLVELNANLLSTNETTNFIYIPLNPAFNSLEIALETEFGQDTIKVSYDYEPKLFASDCEVEPLYSVLKLDYQTFDSLVFEPLAQPPYAEIYY